MANYKYRAIVDGFEVFQMRGLWRMTLDAESAVAKVRATLASKRAGVVGKVERARVAASPVRDRWLPFRAYVVDPGGIVRRTDRTTQREPAAEHHRLTCADSACTKPSCAHLMEWPKG